MLLLLLLLVLVLLLLVLLLVLFLVPCAAVSACVVAVASASACYVAVAVAVAVASACVVAGACNVAVASACVVAVASACDVASAVASACVVATAVFVTLKVLVGFELGRVPKLGQLFLRAAVHVTIVTLARGGEAEGRACSVCVRVCVYAVRVRVCVHVPHCVCAYMCPTVCVPPACGICVPCNACDALAPAPSPFNCVYVCVCCASDVCGLCMWRVMYVVSNVLVSGLVWCVCVCCAFDVRVPRPMRRAVLYLGSVQAAALGCEQALGVDVVVVIPPKPAVHALPAAVAASM